jgi:hypothetical protein
MTELTDAQKEQVKAVVFSLQTKTKVAMESLGDLVEEVSKDVVTLQSLTVGQDPYDLMADSIDMEMGLPWFVPKSFVSALLKKFVTTFKK